MEFKPAPLIAQNELPELIGKLLGRTILNSPSDLSVLDVVIAKIQYVLTVPISALRQVTVDIMLPDEAE